MSFARVEAALEQAVAEREVPGAVLVVAHEGRIVLETAAGQRAVVPEASPMTPDTIFDLASLTKPLATALAIFRLVDEGRVRLDDPVARFFHTFGVHGKSQVTIRDLLTHASGLPAHRPYFEEVSALERGGHLRVGLEDYAGIERKSNVELVREAVQACEAAGRPVARPDEVGKLLDLPR